MFAELLTSTYVSSLENHEINFAANIYFMNGTILSFYLNHDGLVRKCSLMRKLVEHKFRLDQPADGLHSLHTGATASKQESQQIL